MVETAGRMSINWMVQQDGGQWIFQHEGHVVSRLMNGGSAGLCSGEKTSTVLISLLCRMLLLVTLQLNEVLIAGVLSLLAEINIYRLQWICYNSCLTAKSC